MTDLDHKDELASIYSDVHKDVYGFRPRFAESAEHTIEWYEAELDQLAIQADIVFAAEKQAEERAIAGLEASITTLIASGAGDRATAIRWLHEANGTNGNTEYLEFCLGIPYGYFRTENV